MKRCVVCRWPMWLEHTRLALTGEPCHERCAARKRNQGRRQ